MWCDRRIDPGEVYDRAFIVDEGEGGYSWVNCTHCAAMITICDLGGCYNEGICADDFLEFEARDLTELRLKAHWNKKWRRADGTLYPVPTKDVPR
jgi:hypothetical protein